MLKPRRTRFDRDRTRSRVDENESPILHTSRRGRVCKSGRSRPIPMPAFGVIVAERTGGLISRARFGHSRSTRNRETCAT